ncbi:hypothetical protein [Pseudomonas sp. NPDC090592]|uniref:hypothetical protein n=1 Tax=Pseudomonas sp. NPDC090592 TaxID=3364480 RepID=UPI003839E3A3
MDHNWAARKGNMSLDGGYNGSVQQAIANLHVGRDQGRQEGRREGYQEGRQEGYQEGRGHGRKEGFRKGRSHGYTEGWNAGVARANEKLEPLRGYVRQYFEETVQLRGEAERLRELIQLMHGQMSHMAQANRAAGAQGSPEAGLAAEVAALREANRLLHATIEAMEKQFQSTFAQSGLKTQQYNSTLVFTHAAQGVLEELVDEQAPDAQLIRERFVARYQQEVELSVREGDIQVAPEVDEAFGKQLPETQRFIMDMLQSAAPRQEPEEPDPMS